MPTTKKYYLKNGSTDQPFVSQITTTPTGRVVSKHNYPVDPGDIEITEPQYAAQVTTNEEDNATFAAQVAANAVAAQQALRNSATAKLQAAMPTLTAAEINAMYDLSS